MSLHLWGCIRSQNRWCLVGMLQVYVFVSWALCRRSWHFRWCWIYVWKLHTVNSASCKMPTWHCSLLYMDCFNTSGHVAPNAGAVRTPSVRTAPALGLYGHSALLVFECICPVAVANTTSCVDDAKTSLSSLWMICVSLKCVIILLFKLIFAYGVHIAPGHPIHKDIPLD